MWFRMRIYARRQTDTRTDTHTHRRVHHNTTLTVLSGHVHGYTQTSFNHQWIRTVSTGRVHGPRWQTALHESAFANMGRGHDPCSRVVCTEPKRFDYWSLSHTAGGHGLRLPSRPHSINANCADTKLWCLVTGKQECEQLAESCCAAATRAGSEPLPYDCKNDTRQGDKSSTTLH